jgi:predicted glycosyltransferase
MHNGKTALVRGLPGIPFQPAITSTTVEIFNHLPANQLAELMQQAEWVICRSGYSSIMDLVELDQQAILIPTPRQAEQIYLAEHLKRNRLFRVVRQEEWNSIKLDSLFLPPEHQS